MYKRDDNKDFKMKLNLNDVLTAITCLEIKADEVAEELYMLRRMVERELKDMKKAGVKR